MIDRPEPLRRIREVFRVHSIAALLGPRQCGKTTLARVIAIAASSMPCYSSRRSTRCWGTPSSEAVVDIVRPAP